jgi:hypothetical protein
MPLFTLGDVMLIILFIFLIFILVAMVRSR